MAVEPQIAEADLLLDFDNLLLNSGGQQMLGVSGVEQGFPRMTKPARLYILINVMYRVSCGSSRCGSGGTANCSR